jgi:hypothetical protein
LAQKTGIWGLSNHGKRYRTFSNRSNLPAAVRHDHSQTIELSAAHARKLEIFTEKAKQHTSLAQK